jgi:hypothetical protein
MKNLAIIAIVGASCILANFPVKAGGLFENVPGDVGKVGREISKVVTPTIQKGVEAEAARTGCAIVGSMADLPVALQAVLLGNRLAIDSTNA